MSSPDLEPTEAQPPGDGSAPAPPQSHDTFQRAFLLLAVALVSLLFLRMIEAFLMALLLGAITAGMCQPIYLRMLRWLRGRRVLAALLLVVGLIVLVIGPLSTLLGIVVGQAVEVTQDVGPWVEAQIKNPGGLTNLVDRVPFLSGLIERLPFDPVLPDRERMIELAGSAVQNAGRLLVDGLAAAGRGTVTFLLRLFIYLYAVFFFLLSGRALLDRILYLSPLDDDDEQQIMERFTSVTRATLRGSLLIGALQGFMAGVGFAIAGVPGSAFWGTIVVVFSVIPGVGAPIIWVPAVLWLLATGQALPAALLAVYCGAVVGSIDNLLRPRLVGSDARMSDLMILISTLGGISLFGPVGFIVGPIVAAVFVTLWDVYGRAFADSLPPVSRI